ncbi:MAG: hypothetical protein ACE5R4_01790 [Armatimonadota bacterium]
MAQEERPAPEPAPGKPGGAASRLQSVVQQPVRLFLAILAALVVIMLVCQNWPLVRFSLLGWTFDVPGTILYLIFVIVGMVIFWILNIRYTAAQSSAASGSGK